MCPFQTDRMGVLRQAAVDRGPVLGLAIFRETTSDRLRKIDGWHTGKYTVSQDELALYWTWILIRFGTYTYTLAACLRTAVAKRSPSAPIPGRAACHVVRGTILVDVTPVYTVI